MFLGKTTEMSVQILQVKHFIIWYIKLAFVVDSQVKHFSRTVINSDKTIGILNGCTCNRCLISMASWCQPAGVTLSKKK